MKRTYLFSALATGLLTLGACSSDGNRNDEPSAESSMAQQIVLQVANTSGEDTRAGRPLYSEEPKQSIENVKIVICDAENKVVYTDVIADWNTNTVSEIYSTGGHGRQKTITIPNEQKLKAGTYTVYAYGYHTSTTVTSDYDLSSVTSIKKNDEFSGNPVVSLKTTSTVLGEEIFAGSKKLEVKENFGFKVSVILNRQVAGTFGYFESIPYVSGGSKLRLVATSSNKDLVLGGFANSVLTSNGNYTPAEGETLKYTINGYTTRTATKHIIYEINLNEWFSELVNKDGRLDITKWQRPAKYNNVADFKTGSVFGGTFLIPFAKSTVEGAKTFVLELVNATGTVVYKNWQINLQSAEDAKDSQLNKHSLALWNGTAFVTNDNIDTKSCYNVVRNHLYGIGKRTKDNPTNPDDPENKDDDPEPLSTKEELTLRVNDNWEVIHRMDVEEFDVPGNN